MRKHRGFLIFALLIGIAFLVACQPDPTALPEGLGEYGVDMAARGRRSTANGPAAYASKVSVEPGESIDFHISSTLNSKYTAKIYREGDPRVLMDMVYDVSSGYYDCTGKYATGCDWPVSFTYRVPRTWPSGIYEMEVPDAAGGTNKAIFWVRERTSGARSSVLFLSSVNTYQAYNDYAGGSLYAIGGSIKSPMVTFDRPYAGGDGLYTRWEKFFVEWLDRENYDVEYATTYDLAFDPDLLSHYDVAIIAGHSEYWTWDMRDQVKRFIQNGGRFMNLSGNVMWWQIRFEDDGRTMVGYKDWRLDPIKTPQLTTDYNWNYPIFDSPFPIIGLSYLYGGFAGNKGDGYLALNANHWVFNGTGLTENKLFGRGPTRETSIHDKESDGMRLNCAVDGNTILGSPGRSMSPANFTVLGIAPLLNKQLDMNSFGEMGIYTAPGGGAVFSAGATGWILALGQPEVAQITRNVLDAFISGNFPQEPPNVDSQYLFYDRFNCNNIAVGRFADAAAKDIVRLNYAETAGTSGDSLTTQCGIDGAGLQMSAAASGAGVHRFGNPIHANWDGYSQLYTRVYLDLRGLTLKEGSIVNLIEQYNDTRIDKLSPTAVLQVSKQNGNLAIRYQPAGGNLPWVPVPGSTGFWLGTGWNAPANTITLTVDGAGTSYNASLSQLPQLNRFDFGILGLTGSVSGKVCMDELAYNDQPIN